MSTISRGLAWLYDVTGMPQQGVYTAALCEGCCFFFSCFLKRLSLRLLVNGQGGTPQLVECIRKNMHVLCFKCLNERVTELLPIFDTNTPSRQDATKKKNTFFFLVSLFSNAFVSRGSRITYLHGGFLCLFHQRRAVLRIKTPNSDCFFFSPLFFLSYACLQNGPSVLYKAAFHRAHTRGCAHTTLLFFLFFFFKRSRGLLEENVPCGGWRCSCCSRWCRRVRDVSKGERATCFGADTAPHGTGVG